MPEKVRERKSDERHHRRGAGAFDEDEADERDHAGADEDGHAVDEAVDDEAEAERDEERAEPVHLRRGGFVARLDDGVGEDDDEQSDGHVEEEDPAPGGMRDDPSTGDRPDGAGDGAERGPRADGARARRPCPGRRR